MNIKKLITNKPIGIIAIVIVVILSIRFCSSDSDDLVYRFEKIRSESIEKNVSLTGKLELETTYYVKARADGFVKKVYMQAFKPITQGQVIAELDLPNAQFDYEQSALAYRRSQLDLESVRIRFELKKKLFAEGMISKNEFDEEERILKRTDTVYRSALLNLNKARDVFDSRLIRSPITGIAFQINVYDGMEITKGFDIAILTANFKRLTLIGTVNEADVGYIKAGQKAMFTVSAFPNKTFTGNISWINMNPIREGSVVTYQTFIGCDNADQILYPGMTASGSVSVARKENVIAVRNEAFFVSPEQIEKKPNEYIVWVKKSDALKKQKVSIGLMGDAKTEITDKSLKPGDEVLVAIERKKQKSGIKIVQ